MRRTSIIRPVVMAALFFALAAYTSEAVAASKSARKESRKLYKKGLVEFRKDNAVGAIAKFQKAAELDEAFPHPLLALGRIHQTEFETTMHGYPEAAQAYDRLTLILIANPPDERAKDLLQAYYYQGLLCLKGGEYEKAIASLEKFIELYPDFTEMASVYNAIGIAHYYLDNYERAVVNFKLALEMNPAFSEARFNLRSVFTRITAYNEALVLHRAGENEKALGRLKKLRSIAPRFIPGRKLEATILTGLGHPIKAISVLNEVLGFFPDHPESFHLRIDLARLLIQKGSIVKAREVLIENISRFPQHDDQRARMEMANLMSRTVGK